MNFIRDYFECLSSGLCLWSRLSREVAWRPELSLVAVFFLLEILEPLSVRFSDAMGASTSLFAQEVELD